MNTSLISILIFSQQWQCQTSYLFSFLCFKWKLHEISVGIICSQRPKQQLYWKTGSRKGYRKTLFKSWMHVYCLYILMYNSKCESKFSSRSGRSAVQWQQRGGANANTTFEFPIYGSRDAALWWPLGCLGGAGAGTGAGDTGEVHRGPRWNVNFLRSMRPEPGPGQSGQGGAAISTSVLWWIHNIFRGNRLVQGCPDKACQWRSLQVVSVNILHSSQYRRYNWRTLLVTIVARVGRVARPLVECQEALWWRPGAGQRCWAGMGMVTRS